MLVAAEAVLTETRETTEALTVSAFQQAHGMSHRAETTAESFFQTHKDMTVTSKESSSSETARFPREHESLRGCNTRLVWSLGGHDENANSLEIQVHRERLRRTLQ